MNYSLTLPLQWLTFSLLIFLFTSVSSLPPHIPILRTLSDDHTTIPSSASVSEEEFKTHFYNQTLDHFNYRPESYATFKQRYVINSKYWGGANESAPVFVYLGLEASLDDDVPSSIGFLVDNASHFKALLVYIEHRFYGESIPFGPIEEVMRNASIRGYFNSAQAIADYAEMIMYLKKKLCAHNSPVIVVGASYGGLLASWFRLKYPHVALGALASSAPLLYFDDLTPQNGYYSIVTKDFKDVSETCYKTIQQAWSEIDRIASKPNGLSILSQRLKTCTPLNSSFELKDYLETKYAVAAQYNRPPVCPVSVVCGGIDGAKEGNDILGRIFSGLVACNKDNTSCYDTKEYNDPDPISNGWQWQTCSEMVTPRGRGTNDTMFPPAPFNLTSFTKDCMKLYGVAPRPHWVTTYYGGRDIKMVLKKFGSNIIFSNGLKDPWSSGGILEDLSHSLHAVKTANGSHCSDIKLAKPSDPQWLTMQRKVEAKIIHGWIRKYSADLQPSKQ